MIQRAAKSPAKLKPGLHAGRKHKHKVITWYKHEHKMTYADAMNKNFGAKILNPKWRNRADTLFSCTCACALDLHRRRNEASISANTRNPFLLWH